MVYISEKHKGRRISFPDRDISPNKKNEDYHRQWTEAIYSKFLNGKTAWPYDTRSRWEEMRLYSRGEQSTAKYKTWLLKGDSTSEEIPSTYDDSLAESAIGRRAKKDGWYNLLLDEIISPAPKIMNSFHGMFDDLEYDVYVEIIDPKSKQLAEDEKWKKIAEGQNQQWQNEFKTRAGLPMDYQGPLPKSEEEFDFMAAQGGFKLGIAKAMQKLVRAAIDQDSKWVDVIKKKLLTDFIVIGKAAVKEYYDEEDGRFKAKYIDVVDTVIQYSKEFDHNDSEYAGYFTNWTISNLRIKRPDIKEEQWKILARKHLGYLGNPTSSVGFDDNIYNIDEFKVCVFEGEWIDTDYKKAFEYHSIRGRDTYHRIDYDTEIKPLSAKQIQKGAKQKIVKTPKRVLRECSWVVGSDIVFDLGLVNMANRPRKTKPMLRIKVESLQMKSITEQLYPIYDQFMMAWLRHQNSMAKMFEKGYAVDIGLLMNMTDGDGKKWSLNDILEFWGQTGVLPFMTSLQGDYRGGAVMPIHEIPGGLGERLMESIELFAWCFKMIEDITGINPVALGATPDAKAPVTTTRFALQATSNALKPIVTGILELKENVAGSIMRRIQIGIRNSKDVRDVYSGVIGSGDIETMRLAERDGAQYGTAMKQRPGTVYREKLANYIKAAVQSGRDGAPGLTIPQAMYFEEMIDQGGDLIEIRQQIAYEMEKANQQKFAQEQQNIQSQNQGLQQLEAQKGEKEMAMKKADSELRMMEDDMATQNKMKIDRVNNNYKTVETLIKGVQAEEQAERTVTSESK